MALKKKQPPPLPEGKKPNPRKKKGSAVKPRRHLPMSPDRRAALIRRLDTEDDRTGAIVSTVMLENSLALAIISRLRRLSTHDHKELFDREGATLRDFRAKIQIGYALGLYGRAIRDELDRIRRIRNAFAHNIAVRKFNSPHIRKDFSNLESSHYQVWVLGHPWPFSKVETFASAVIELQMRLDREAKQRVAPKRPLGVRHDREREAFRERFAQQRSHLTRKPDRSRKEP